MPPPSPSWGRMLAARARSAAPGGLNLAVWPGWRSRGGYSFALGDGPGLFDPRSREHGNAIRSVGYDPSTDDRPALDVARWTANYTDERQGAALAESLAAAEKDAERAAILSQLASVERATPPAGRSCARRASAAAGTPDSRALDRVAGAAHRRQAVCRSCAAWSCGRPEPRGPADAADFIRGAGTPHRCARQGQRRSSRHAPRRRRGRRNRERDPGTGVTTPGHCAPRSSA
jgi:hypothetical protein